MVLLVSPRGKGRPRFGAGRTFTDPQTVAAEAEIRWLVQMEHPPKLEGPLSLVAEFYFKRPKSCPKSRHYPQVKPDYDNIAKMLTDALNGLCYADDAQIVRATISKRYGDPERIEFNLREME